MPGFFTNLIRQNYQIGRCLGKGGMGSTYEAIDLKSNSLVAIKIVSLREAQSWKIIELFEREAQILSCLEHANIPQYLNYFELDTSEDRYFCLVREFIAGASLSELVEQNHQFTEADVCQITRQILLTLEYLHSFPTPIIHRDIKPENIIKSIDGSIYLVDFGSIQSGYRREDSYIATFVGTAGYMPPEQFTGRVTVASDLYSLGCTVLFLLFRRSPAELPTKRLKIDFRARINISSGLASWLDRLLEPIAEDRFDSATAALKALPTDLINQSRSIKTKVEPVNRSANKECPRFSANPCLLENFLVIEGNTLFINSPSSTSFQPQSLSIYGRKFTLKLNALGLQHIVTGNAADLAISLVKKNLGGARQSICCSLYDGNHYYNFGNWLDPEQQSQVVAAISRFISDWTNSR